MKRKVKELPTRKYAGGFIFLKKDPQVFNNCEYDLYPDFSID